LQLTPVLVDVDLYNMNISIDRIKAITSKKKAIVPVHLFGRAANMEAIMALKEHNLYVLEDNAQAIELIAVLFGPKESWNHRTCSATSFFHLKPCCYGDGGAILQMMML
jgi:dTDP-4-amino-4,6-dideoxygalactose transaminase